MTKISHITDIGIKQEVIIGLRGIQLDTRFNPAFDDWQLPPKTGRLSQHVIDTIQTFPTPSGHGVDKPFKLLPYQKHVIKKIYATTPAGHRKIKEALISVPRGSGKTGLVVMLLLYELLTRDTSELYVGAASKEQSGRTFQEMVRVIIQVKNLFELLNITSFQKKIQNRETNTIFRALSSDANIALGLAAGVAIVDEVCAHKDDKLFQALKTGMGKAPNTLLITTSTMAAENKTGNPMTQLVKYASEHKSKTFFSYIRSAPMNIDPFSDEAIKLANPALGRLKKLDDLREQANMAKHMAGREMAYRAFILNQPVDPRHEDMWLDPQLIVDLSKPLRIADFHGRDACIGVDASSTRDLTAVCLIVLPNKTDDKHTVFVKSFAPQAAVKALKNQNYLEWQKQGLIEIADTHAIDLKIIYDHIVDLHTDFNIVGLANDPWALARIKEDCKRAGLSQTQVERFEQVRQGFRTMSPLIKYAEHMIFNGKVRFAFNPCLVWQFHNAVICRDPAANRKITREKCVDKVDAILAFLCALQVLIKKPEKRKVDFDNMFFDMSA